MRCRAETVRADRRVGVGVGGGGGVVVDVLAAEGLAGDGDVLGLDRPREEAEAQLGTLLHPLYLRPHHNTHR